MRAIQARAILNERDYCTPDDIKLLAASVCAHRLTLTIEGDENDERTNHERNSPYN